MKAQNSSENDAALSKALREWTVESSLPPRFGDQVWRRIAQAEIPAVNPLLLLREWVAQALLRPSFAMSYAAVLLLAGLTAGFWQGHVKSERTSQALSTRYVQMVDPYQLPRN